MSSVLEQPKICNSILDHIGHTPLVRINNITKDEGIECEVLAKCEFFNAGGSIKDRIGKRMVLDAQASGRIKKGDVLIEPTSGNTGVGMALTAAVEGYKMIITLPEKMSKEKVDVLKALGAEIIRTPTEAAWDAPESHIGVAKTLNQTIPNSHILDQYINPSNPNAHYEGTAEELLEQCDGHIDYLIATAGTGGTITGIAKKLKEKIPGIQVIGVDPVGSILAQPETLNKTDITSYHVEGIGYDFIPDVLERQYIDKWTKSVDLESFTMARRLIRREGLLVGGSSGACMAAAVRVIKELNIPKGKRVVVIFADSVRNYMSKFLSDDWMVEQGFMAPPKLETAWAVKTVADLTLQSPLTVAPAITASACIETMKAHGFDQMPVVSESGDLVGVVTIGNLTSRLTQGRVNANDAIDKVIFKQFKRVTAATTLGELSSIFDRDHYAIAVMKSNHISNEGKAVQRELCTGVVTRIDLVNYIAAFNKAN
jgi:cystathionine beta-synthase